MAKMQKKNTKVGLRVRPAMLVALKKSRHLINHLEEKMRRFLTRPEFENHDSDERKTFTLSCVLCGM